MSSILTLTVLSSITAEYDVFNHLVEVRRHDTGEVGTLLCSHCCKWPKELLAKATWIEGCYTPPEYENDPRLLMGYHPRSMTRWSFDKEHKELKLIVPNPITGRNADTIVLEDVPVFLPFYDEEIDDWSNLPGGRLLQRLWREMVEHTDREFVPAVSAFYRSATALAHRGVVPFASVSGLWLMGEVEAACEDNNVQFEGTFQIWGAHSIPESEMYAEALVIVGGDTPGYARAWELEEADYYRMLQFVHLDALCSNDTGFSNLSYFDMHFLVSEGNYLRVCAEVRRTYDERNWESVLPAPERVMWLIGAGKAIAELVWYGENHFEWETSDWPEEANWVLLPPTNLI